MDRSSLVLQYRKMFSKVVIQENISVKGLSSFKIPGKARYFSVANNITELNAIVDFCWQVEVPYLVIGDGTNLLFAEDELNACLIKLSGEFSQYKIDNGKLTAGAGTPLFSALLAASDFEAGTSIFLGLPGTIGGAIKGNAGIQIKGKRIGILDAIEQISLLQGNKTYALPKEKIEYGYRYANLEGIILEADFNLDFFRPFRGHIIQRPKVEPFPNIGCIFKNPNEKTPAGLLIDKAGLKGKRIGGAMISKVHGNFILNIDNASYKDIMELIELVQQVVEKIFGIKLELEAKVITNESLRANGRFI